MLDKDADKIVRSIDRLTTQILKQIMRTKDFEIASVAMGLAIADLCLAAETPDRSAEEIFGRIYLPMIAKAIADRRSEIAKSDRMH